MVSASMPPSRRPRKARPAPPARAAAAPPGVARPAPEPPPAPDAMRRGYARSEERNAAIRAGLTPLAPGERPPALLVAIGLSAFVAVANVAIWALGGEVSGQGTGAVGVLSFAAIMLAAAGGMWARRAWALLGFQALLAITIVFSFLALAVASNLLAVGLCLVTIGLGGWLFWKLIRVLARIQAPGRPG
jgi:hypothetical protein